MNNTVRVPVIEQREGKPFNNYEKVGPFTLHESNKGSYFLYSVSVTGGINILKQASKPNLYDICHALKQAYNDKLISKEVFVDYRDKVEAYRADKYVPPASAPLKVVQKGKRK